MAAPLLGPAPASALSFSPCSFQPNAGCARVSVPLDRSGSLPGSVSLQVERFNTTPGAASGALVAIAGGPGQAATPVFDEPYLNALEAALGTHDFVTLDLRGTGRSDVLSCPGFNVVDLANVTRAAGACATYLGPRRAFYTTSDAVDDIEAVRAALGVQRIALYGISYGSKVALAYATRYPGHVERIVLDSVLGLEGPDPLYGDTLAAIPRVLRALCRHGGCRGITRDPARDLSALTARLRRAPLRGFAVDDGGRRHQVRLRGVDLFGVLLSGDLAPAVRAGLPAALRSALRGDAAPLLRLEPPGGKSLRGSGVAIDSRALFAATTCEESLLPWDRTAPLADRPAQARARVAALPGSAFAPFDGATMLASEYVQTCLRWPQAPTPPAAFGGPPNVPALLLDGESDLRTPVEGARRVAASLQGSTLVVSPATGHGVLPNPPACVKRALTQFFAGARVSARCAFGAPPAALRPLAIAPTSLRAVPHARAVRGLPGRTLTAVGLELADLGAQLRNPALGPGDSLGGLRGGYFRLDDTSVSLTRLEFVPGVAVSGRLTARGGALTISGRAAAHGRLTIHRRGLANGMLGGRTVRGRVPASLLQSLG